MSYHAVRRLPPRRSPSHWRRTSWRWWRASAPRRARRLDDDQRPEIAGGRLATACTTPSPSATLVDPHPRDASPRHGAEQGRLLMANTTGSIVNLCGLALLSTLSTSSRAGGGRPASCASSGRTTRTGPALAIEHSPPAWPSPSGVWMISTRRASTPVLDGILLRVRPVRLPRRPMAPAREARRPPRPIRRPGPRAQPSASAAGSAVIDTIGAHETDAGRWTTGDARRRLLSPTATKPDSTYPARRRGDLQIGTSFVVEA